MKHYYRGDFPEGYKEWKATATQGDYLIDPDFKVTAFFYKSRFRLRNEIGQWVTLGSAPIWNTGWHFHVVLQSSNREWLSDYTLERRFNEVCPHDVFEYEIMPLEEKTRQVMAEGRLQQSQWAAAVKAKAGGRCMVTGSTVGLQACHIKPFAICTAAEAVDVANGICLTASIHALFDSGAELPAGDPLATIIDKAKWAALLKQREARLG